MAVNERAKAYQKLMRIRKQAMLWLFSFPLIALFGVQIQKIGIPAAAPVVIWIAIAVGLWARLRAFDSCPWCNMTFFIKNPLFFSGLDYLFRKNCAHCGCPDKAKGCETL